MPLASFRAYCFTTFTIFTHELLCQKALHYVTCLFLTQKIRSDNFLFLFLSYIRSKLRINGSLISSDLFGRIKINKPLG